MQCKLDNGILTAPHFWHYIFPTWKAHIKFKFSKQIQENYLHHLKTIRYQPWKIKIESKLEVDAFLTTIAICFNFNIEFNMQTGIGEIKQKL